MPRPFDHRKLVAYQHARSLYVQVHALVGNATWTERPLACQLLRASHSIALNIAEGAGEHSPADKARFYRIARRSAAECDAALDLLSLLPRYSNAAFGEPLQRLTEIAALLTTMILNLRPPTDR